MRIFTKLSAEFDISFPQNCQTWNVLDGFFRDFGEREFSPSPLNKGRKTAADPHPKSPGAGISDNWTEIRGGGREGEE